MAARSGLSSSPSSSSSLTVSMPVVYELERGMGEVGGDVGSSITTVAHRSSLVILGGFLATGGLAARLMWGEATMPTCSCSCCTAALCLRMAGDALMGSEEEKESKAGRGCISLCTGAGEVAITLCCFGIPFFCMLSNCSTWTTSGVGTEVVEAEDGVGEMLEREGVEEMLGGGGGGGGGDWTLWGEADG